MTEGKLPIITAAVLRYESTLKELKILVESNIFEFTVPSSSYYAEPYNSYPKLSEMVKWIARGADFQHSNTDRIMADGYTFHYYVSAPTPISSTSFTTVYLCLIDPLVFNDNLSEIFFVKEFLIEIEQIIEDHSTSNMEQSAEMEKIRSMLSESMMNANNKAVSKNNSAFQEFAGNDKITELNKQVKEVTSVMSDNVIRILERGERLENLDHRTEALQASSQHFKTTARRVQRNMFLQNVRWTVVLIALGVGMATLVLFVVLHKLGVFSPKKP